MLCRLSWLRRGRARPELAALTATADRRNPLFAHLLGREGPEMFTAKTRSLVPAKVLTVQSADSGLRTSAEAMAGQTRRV